MTQRKRKYMHPTVHEIEVWFAAVKQWQEDSNAWAEQAKDDINNGRAIGSNPPTPPPPPPGTHY